MIFWKKEIKNFIYTVNYEDLVAGYECKIFDQSENVLKFEKECLNFNENNSPINTMSVMQAKECCFETRH